MLFWYTRKQVIGGTSEAPEYGDMRDCFNTNKIIRCHELAKGNLTVVLDDIHERITKTEVMKGKSKETRNERETVQSEITLGPEDTERFYKLTKNDN